MNRQPASPPVNRPEGSSPFVTSEIAAEAAVWIARLHGPDRSINMERECLAWQGRSAAHRVAFERCTDTWQDVTRVTLVNAYATVASQRPEAADAGRLGRPRSSRWAVAFVFAALTSLGVVCVQVWRDVGVYSTGVGEQQLVVLDDGSRMSLNTDSRVRVDLGSMQRMVSVEAGEALFEVAKDPRRPFVVRAGGSEVVALGTAFTVRLVAGRTHADDALAVTLIEGQITVRQLPGTPVDALAPATPVSMQAGERIRLARGPGSLAGAAKQKLDRPRIDDVVAWKRSEAVFDDVSLADAVSELNRYSRTQIVLVGGVSLGSLRVSGVYRTGDTASFARAVATLHGLRVQEHQGRLELAAPQ